MGPPQIHRVDGSWLGDASQEKEQPDLADCRRKLRAGHEPWQVYPKERRGQQLQQQQRQRHQHAQVGQQQPQKQRGLTAGTNGSLDSSSIISSDFANSEPSRAPTTNAPLHSILVKPRNFSQSVRGPRSSSRDSSSKHKEHPNRLRLRSKSLSDLRQDNDATANGSGASGCYSDDEDGDDFGFLSHPLHAGTVSVVSRASAAMHKAKSASGTSSPSHRLLPRRWRTRGKSSAASAHPAQPMWTPEVSDYMYRGVA